MQCYIAANCIDILASMSDCSVDCILTDPPYGVGDNYRTHEDTAELLRQLVLASLFAHCKKSDSHAGVKNMWLYPRPNHIGSFFIPARQDAIHGDFHAGSQFCITKKTRISKRAKVLDQTASRVQKEPRKTVILARSQSGNRIGCSIAARLLARKSSIHLWEAERLA